ncbi:hypothetical protein LEP1GSC059_0336 [Leptospira noguchii serovar Panama str. CZ214]|uniref:Uncharacterized protein n=1 Tax=Leptospira noguchii serovar Panama str. CZ214 TaxID=1001595 RepID=T0H1T8_9LEPT|nr:hypothetical protein LEP1GSC059_0336 [Leptospira noguchii serovar Panama str. CZ214]
MLILCFVGKEFMNLVLGFPNKGKFKMYYESLMYGNELLFSVLLSKRR